jgi:hypothetical protein
MRAPQEDGCIARVEEREKNAIVRIAGRSLLRGDFSFWRYVGLFTGR